MSSKSNRRKRRQLSEVPLMIERVQKVEQHHDNGSGYIPGKTYEEANWAKLSPIFRATHNKLRQARGLPTIPPPAVDLYVKPAAPLIKPFDPTDKEFVAATREFLGGTLMGGSAEGFSINGRLIK